MIREKTIFVIQRMIQILGEHVIPMFKNVISELFSLATEPSELTNILVLLNHLLSKTQKKSFELIEEIFLPIIQKVFGLISNGNYNQFSQAEIDREQSVLHKQYFMFIQSICNNKLLPVFTSQSKFLINQLNFVNHIFQRKFIKFESNFRNYFTRMSTSINSCYKNTNFNFNFNDSKLVWCFFLINSKRKY